MNHCYHCMAEIKNPESRFCPRCGKEHNIHYSQSFELPAGTYLCDKRYLVGRSLGIGGFGITYIGFDTKINKKIVIKETFYNGIFKRNNQNVTLSEPLKVTYDSSISLDEIMNKTQKECFSLSKAENFNNIVKVYDWFAENNTAYIITEYINGDTLHDRVIQNGAYGWNDFYSKFKPLMQSLAQLHKMDLLHRDIKPQNIMIKRIYDEEETFVLIDFGLARSNQTRTLASVAIAFSPGYSSFEQRTLTQKDGTYTDVYALAATMYYALSGQAPSDNIAGDIYENFPLLKELRNSGKISERVFNAMVHALQPDFRNRCQTIDEFTSEIEGERSAYVTPIESPFNRSGSNSTQFATDSYDDDDLFANISQTRSERTNYAGAGSGRISPPPTTGQPIDFAPNDARNYVKNQPVPVVVQNEEKKHKIANFMICLCIAAVICTVVVFLDASNVITAIDLINPVSAEETYEEEEYAVVPDVTEINKVNAMDTLEERGFDFQVTMQPTDAYDENYVVSQYPTAGMDWKKGEIVDIYVAQPIGNNVDKDENIDVPDVVNKNYYDAADALIDLGFEVAWETTYRENVQSNKIEKQEPKAGTSVKYGTKVTLYVLQNVNLDDYAEVGDYVGQNIDEVKKQLESKGLKVTYSVREVNDQPSGTILEQNFDANKRYKKGKTLNFIVARPVSEGTSSLETSKQALKVTSSESKTESKKAETSSKENVSSKAEVKAESSRPAETSSKTQETSSKTEVSSASVSSKRSTSPTPKNEKVFINKVYASTDGTNGEPDTDIIFGADIKPEFGKVIASSELDPQGTHTYYAENVCNNDGSCWTEDKEGSGIGEYVEFSDSEYQIVHSCSIYNGYNENVESFKNNSRLTRVKFEFSDGSTLTYELDANNMGEQICVFPKAVRTKSIKIIIDDVRDGDLWDDTCISCIVPK